MDNWKEIAIGTVIYGFLCFAVLNSFIPPDLIGINNPYLFFVLGFIIAILTLNSDRGKK